MVKENDFKADPDDPFGMQPTLQVYIGRQGFQKKGVATNMDSSDTCFQNVEFHRRQQLFHYPLLIIVN